MDIVYGKKETEKICTDIKHAKKKMEANIALKLHNRISLIEEFETLEDVILFIPFHFHKLNGKLAGKFALDVAGRKCGCRIIIEPLNSEGHRYEEPRIDLIAKTTKMLLIVEVSDHYE